LSVKRIINHWTADPSIADNIASINIIPERFANYHPFPDNLDRRIVEALKQNGINALYSHQNLAWEYIQAGKNILISTGTSSGKSLCYILPVLNILLENSNFRTLIIYPTKALAQDQLNSISRIINSIPQIKTYSPKVCSIYDGDTPANQRSIIRSSARIVITNPDMLHIGILPHHTSWEDFFINLNLIIVDEIHLYRGVFGSHVANVFRRLKRITNHYTSSPKYILTSATVANPIDFGERLIEEKLYYIDQDGSARGKQTQIIYNPPIVNPELGIRRSVVHEATKLSIDLLINEVQTLIFGRSRRTVELTLSYLREKVELDKFESKAIIRGYRGGYLPGDRRKIEQEIREGNVKVTIATNALELGINIGGMGAVIMIGYPGSIAATIQQSGRAGRGEDESLAVLVTSSDPLDQYLAFNPEYLFNKIPEQVLINPDNLLILLSHIRCAAFEISFKPKYCFGNLETELITKLLDHLDQIGELYKSGDNYFWMDENYPAQQISLRATTTDNVMLFEEDKEFNNKHHKISTIGVIDKISAYWMTHKDAIYFHEGNTYFVNELDLEKNVAWIERIDTDYITEPRKNTEISLISKISEENAKNALKMYGDVKVSTQVIGYNKIKWYTHERFDSAELTLPPSVLITTAYWLNLADELVNELRKIGIWSNDNINYGKEWNIIKNRIRIRDSFKCQLCGTKEINKAHHIHHKIPARFFANIEEANRENNLITLCSKCHHQAELTVRIRSGLAGTAYVLGHIAPLFLMCDPSDLGVHSDQSSTIADGAATIIIYDQVPAGIGFSQYLFEIHDTLIKKAHELVIHCKCQNGCPSCVGPGGIQGYGGKAETLAILAGLSGQ